MGVKQVIIRGFQKERDRNLTPLNVLLEKGARIVTKVALTKKQLQEITLKWEAQYLNQFVYRNYELVADGTTLKVTNYNEAVKFLPD